MKILYSPDDYLNSGEVLSDRGRRPRRYISSVVLGLRDHGHHVDTASIESDDWWYRWIRRATFERYDRYIAAKIIVQALRLAKHSIDYDAIIAGRATGAACAFLHPVTSGRKAKLIPVWYAPLHNGRIQRFRHRLYEDSVDYLIGVSRRQAPLLAESARIPVERVLTIPMGVDTRFFTPGDTTLKHKYLVSVGDEKRDDELLCKVAPLLPLPIIRVSPAPVSPSLRSPGIRYEVAIPAERLLRLYREAAAALVLTMASSDVPGLTSILEAMAVGIPVIASETIATAEYVRNGETGFIVRQSDPTDVVQAVHSLLEGHRVDSFGRAARTLVEERFTIERGTSCLADELRKLDARC
jgi:glycosyltransferase involved in cell wall biosynthesis